MATTAKKTVKTATKSKAAPKAAAKKTTKKVIDVKAEKYAEAARLVHELLMAGVGAVDMGLEGAEKQFGKFVKRGETASKTIDKQIVKLQDYVRDNTTQLQAFVRDNTTQVQSLLRENMDNIQVLVNKNAQEVQKMINDRFGEIVTKLGIEK